MERWTNEQMDIWMDKEIDKRQYNKLLKERVRSCILMVIGGSMGGIFR